MFAGKYCSGTLYSGTLCSCALYSGTQCSGTLCSGTLYSDTLYSGTLYSGTCSAIVFRNDTNQMILMSSSSIQNGVVPGISQSHTIKLVN